MSSVKGIASSGTEKTKDYSKFFGGMYAKTKITHQLNHCAYVQTRKKCTSGSVTGKSDSIKRGGSAGRRERDLMRCINMSRTPTRDTKMYRVWRCNAYPGSVDSSAWCMRVWCSPRRYSFRRMGDSNERYPTAFVMRRKS